jgi:hypothetical protein
MVSLGARGWLVKGLHCLGLQRLYAQGMEWCSTGSGVVTDFDGEYQLVSDSSVGVG